MNLSDTELLSKLLSIEYDHALKIVGLSKGLRTLGTFTRAELGLSAKQFERLQLAIEFQTRRYNEDLKGRDVVREPEAVVTSLRGTIRDLPGEVFRVMYLNKANKVIRQIDFTGTLDQCAVHPREILREALLCHASAVILAHNHPSGRPEPSLEDRQLTSRLKDALAVIPVRVLDHIIIGDNNYFSFQEHGLV